MKKIHFIFGVHCHQPVGNFDNVIEESYRKGYQPFLRVLSEHPSVKIVFHCTGYLLEWLKAHHGEYFDLLRELIRRNQVELMTGGFYEPLLAVLPEADAINQIKMLTGFIEENFGYEPQGMWLAERVWEPHLAKPIARAGVKYVTVDDYHFLGSIGRDELFGYFSTEEQGYRLSIFPISEPLRYYLPFRQVHEAIDYFRTIASEDRTNLAVMLDDGEKFGVWPTMYEWVYEKGWLDTFFTALEENAEWIQTSTFSEFTRSHPPYGHVYLPTASYFEMGQWALPADLGRNFEELLEELKRINMFDRCKPYLRGGFWRNFLAKYPESNALHKKMLYVSQKVNALHKRFNAQNGQNYPVELQELFKGQCNDGYWHGVFGGLYMPHLRHAVYQHLIRAEKLADERRHKRSDRLEAKVLDFDKDGHDECLISSTDLNLYFDPARGGSLFELDYKPKDFNLINTLSRKMESYHYKLINAVEGQSAGQPNHSTIPDMKMESTPQLRELLHYDWYRRVCLLDHFLGASADLESFSQSRYHEVGNFIDRPYSHSLEKKRQHIQLTLKRQGEILSEKQNRSRRVEVAKSITVHKSHAPIHIQYRIVNLEGDPIDLWFGVEFNFSLLGAADPARYFAFNGDPGRREPLNTRRGFNDIHRMSLFNEPGGFVIDLEFRGSLDVWCFPIETVSQSESGYEKIYQSSVTFPHWKRTLNGNESWEEEILLSITEL